MKENKKEVLKQISEQELSAYLSMCDEDTPDLWNRIEAGYEKEINAAIDVAQTDSKLVSINRKIKRFRVATAIAAAVLITLIAVPVIIFSNMTMRNKSAPDMVMSDDKNNMVYEQNIVSGDNYNYDNESQDEEMMKAESGDEDEQMDVTVAVDMTEGGAATESAGVTQTEPAAETADAPKQETGTNSMGLKDDFGGYQKKLDFEKFLYKYEKSLKVMKKFM
ncbi:MAG: hypothetical protein K2G45_01670 [Lachnospiraceae bacterium]|nr:hypothetical protein [Lachnospiraceae bacterium]